MSTRYYQEEDDRAVIHVGFNLLTADVYNPTNGGRARGPAKRIMILLIAPSHEKEMQIRAHLIGKR